MKKLNYLFLIGCLSANLAQAKGRENDGGDKPNNRPDKNETYVQDFFSLGHDELAQLFLLKWKIKNLNWRLNNSHSLIRSEILELAAVEERLNNPNKVARNSKFAWENADLDKIIDAIKSNKSEEKAQ